MDASHQNPSGQEPADKTPEVPEETKQGADNSREVHDDKKQGNVPSLKRKLRDEDYHTPAMKRFKSLVAGSDRRYPTKPTPEAAAVVLNSIFTAVLRAAIRAPVPESEQEEINSQLSTLTIGSY